MRAPIERRPPYGLAIWCAVTIMVSLLFYATPARLTQATDLMPLLPLIALFLWSTIRPYFIPPIVIFVVGILQDLLTSGPMGVWALAYLVALTVMRVRKEDSTTRDLGPLWFRFVATTAIAVVVAWAGGSLAISGPAAIQPMAIEAAASILMFPLIALVTVRKRQSRGAFG